MGSCSARERPAVPGQPAQQQLAPSAARRGPGGRAPRRPVSFNSPSAMEGASTASVLAGNYSFATNADLHSCVTYENDAAAGGVIIVRRGAGCDEDSDEEGGLSSTGSTTPARRLPRHPRAVCRAAALRLRCAAGARCAPQLRKPWDVDMLDASGVAHLASGGSLFAYSCKGGEKLVGAERERVMLLIDTAPPAQRPAVPALDPSLVIMSKAAFGIPGVRLADLSASLVSSYEYQHACTQSSIRIHKTAPAPDTFRLVKTVIPVLYSLTIQYHVREVPAAELPALSAIADGARVDRAFTHDEQNGAKGEFLRTIILFHELADGAGLLFWSVTVAIRASLPGFVLKIVDSIQEGTCADFADIAEKTRRFFAARR